MSIIVAGVIGGCSPDPTVTAPWGQEFEEAIQSSDSDFVRAILKDGLITTSEMQEARSRQLECMRDAGVDVDIWEDDHGWSGLVFQGEVDETVRDIELRCDNEWLGPIAQLYQMIHLNPDNVSWGQLVTACLHRHGLVPEGFTERDLDELIEQGSIRITLTGDETPEEIAAMQTAANELPDIILPGGQPLDEGQAALCQTNPQS